MKKVIAIMLIVLSLCLFGCNDKDSTLSQAVEWVKENYEGITIEEDITFKETIEEFNATLSWEIENNDYLNSDGSLNGLPEYDEEVKVKVIVTANNDSSTLTFTITIKGYSEKFNGVILELDNRMKEYQEVNSDIELPLTLTNNNNTFSLKWESSNKQVISNDGKVKQGSDDTIVTLTCQITLDKYSKTKEYQIKVLKNDRQFALAEEWILNWFKDKIIDSDISLPTEIAEYNAKVTWTSLSEYIDDNGKYTAPILDTVGMLVALITINGEEDEFLFEVNIKGWGDEFDYIEDWVKRQINPVVTSTINLPTFCNAYPESTMSWKSSREDVLTSTGKVYKLDTEDVEVVLTCTINYNGKSKTFNYTVTVPQKSDIEKNVEIREWLDSLFSDIEEVSSDLDLPSIYEKYQTKITWETNSPGVITESGKYHTPLFDRTVELTASFKMGSENFKVSYRFKTYGQVAKDTWEAVDMLLKYIALERITNQKYFTYGYQAAYKENAVTNLGYLPFYVNENSERVQEILELTHGRNRTGILKTSTEYIVIHDTASADPTATARAHANWLKSMTNDPNNDQWVSWHFTVDEKEIIQHLPLDEVAYHAGDGSHVFGDTYFNTDYNKESIGGGNRNGIGIETCVNYGSDYNITMRKTAKLVAELLIEYNLGIDRVKQHNDFSGKDCPMTMRHAGRWQEFLTLVEIEYFAKTRLKDVTFKWTSLSPDIMDDTGKVFNHPGNETTVKYKVDVTYNGETKTFEFTSILNALN